MRYQSPKSRRRRWLIGGLGLLVLATLGPYGWSRWASSGRRVSLHSHAKQAIQTDQGLLRIATYNIAHGRGQTRSNWQGGNQSQRLTRLEGITQLLREIDADIVILNEVDFDSSWSYHINQARYLAEQADYPFWIEQRNLDFRMLFWTWRFGNAILSKIPLSDPAVIDFPAYSPTETAVAGKKRGVMCTCDTANRPFRIIAAHMSHRSEAIRAQSAKIVVDIVSSNGLPTVLAGDLNSTPSGFPQHIQDADEGNALDILDSSKFFNRHPKTAPTSPDELTFDSSDPKSVIDWILPTREWKVESYSVIDSKLSDHRPVVVELRWQTHDD